MTQFFIDSDSGSDANDGLTTGAAFATFNKFTETSRTAGDIGTARRNTSARYDDAGALDFTSSGTYASPLTLEADFDNNFSDDATSSQTYTPVFGSKTMTAGGTITGIVAGDWVYNTTDSDDPREFSYEVASVSGTTLTLFLPWKGSTGSTKTLTIMGTAPVWGATTSFAFDINLFFDDFWYLQGIEFRSSSTGALFDMEFSLYLVIKDCICKGTSTIELFDCGGTSPVTRILKSRCLEYEAVVDSKNGTLLIFENCLFDGNSVAVSVESTVPKGTVSYISCEAKNHTTADLTGTTTENGTIRNLRNFNLDSTTKFSGVGNSISSDMVFFIEDSDGSVSVSGQHSGRSISDTVFIQASNTGTVRSGGGNISLLITPSLQLGVTEGARYLVFEYPIFATTSSKTYTVFFKSNATTDWTTSPTATEIFLELEAWGSASNNFRKKTQSTGTVDFTTDTDFDQSLAVTVAPAQAGVAYLRLYYGKPKETSKDNKFFIDPKIVIS